MAVPPVDLIRRALERAVEVARAGEAERPPVPAPAGLRPVLGFRKLPPAALVTVAQVVDTEDQFRERVAAATDRDSVGRVAWLWLRRPDGWVDELAQLVDELAVDAAAPATEQGSDKSLRRKLEGAERAARRAAEQVARSEAELERAQREVQALRAAQSSTGAHVAELEHEVASLVDQRTLAVAELKRVENLLNRRTAEKRILEQRVSDLEHARAGTVPEPPSSVDLDEIRRTLRRLEQRAAAFTDDLSAVRALLSPPHLGDAAGTAPTSAGATASTKRRAVPIPYGLTDDSTETASQLVCLPRAVLLVDGYNLSMTAWPEADIAEQRARLERLLADLVARTSGLTIDLVFDGAEVVPLIRPGARWARGITVRFTPPDVEADDELLELVERYPNDRPVIVASDDRRVRDGARRRGANVVSAAQLLALVRA